jgi:hypothetical protein
MAWEERGGRRYYYRKVWKDGRCFTVYEGPGIVGHLAEERDRVERKAARAASVTLRAERAALDEVDAMIDEDWRGVKAAVDDALEAAGYHRHKRQWRRRRNAASG